MDSLQDLVQPELLVMIPALNFAATLLKKRGVASTSIPACLGGAGVFLGLCYELASVQVTDLRSVFDILFTGVTQGLLCAAGAVYLHQLKHQKEKAEHKPPESAPLAPRAAARDTPKQKRPPKA